MHTADNLTFSDIQAAAQRIKGHAHRTPVMTSATANALTGAELFFKCENFQRIGAFKFRGAFNALSRFSEEQRRNGVLTYSSGNHAQAIALAARLLKIRAVIIMPEDAPVLKIQATKGYGAEVLTYNRYTENREEIGRKLAQERNMTLIPPYDHPDVICGQGTAAMELFEEVGELDVLLVCLGGGGLLAGSALAASGLSPHCKVIGVEPELGDDGRQSFRKGEIVHIDVPDTIADGAKVTHVGSHNFAVIQKHVADIVTVSDAQLISAMKFFAERMKMVVEPTGCLAAAAAFNQVWPVTGKRVGVILSGGNVDLQSFAQFIS
ncbi:Threonine dehydratase [Collimonas arenae]|uniref:Threonine dehydratase n=1 Tax=Collimonas arenae TaxID=279058 RepID=A0A0A1F5X8_9BURK|nr:threo-3-hydroxy-L-aspartate ammonia-lyase [Collimonas arenae]AIY39195.1 Threonine dehydratase [Collimonas arenae]